MQRADRQNAFRQLMDNLEMMVQGANKVPFTVENDGYMGSGVAYFDYDISNK